MSMLGLPPHNPNIKMIVLSKMISKIDYRSLSSALAPGLLGESTVAQTCEQRRGPSVRRVLSTKVVLHQSLCEYILKQVKTSTC